MIPTQYDTVELSANDSMNRYINILNVVEIELAEVEEEIIN